MLGEEARRRTTNQASPPPFCMFCWRVLFVLFCSIIRASATPIPSTLLPLLCSLPVCVCGVASHALPSCLVVCVCVMHAWTHRPGSDATAILSLPSVLALQKGQMYSVPTIRRGLSNSAGVSACLGDPNTQTFKRPMGL